MLKATKYCWIGKLDYICNMNSLNPSIYVCLQSWVPLRSSSSSASEMVSSLLFGERCEELQSEGDWLKVRCLHDWYIGWIPKNYLYPLTADLVNHRWSVVQDADSAWLADNNQFPGLISQGNTAIALSPGSWVPSVEEIFVGNQMFRYARRSTQDSWLQPSRASLSTHLSTEQRFVESARLFLHTPYLWGGRSIWGIDCSGLVQVAAAMSGIKLPRDAYQQAEVGAKKMWNQAAAGDLAFFANTEGRVTHVGIVLENAYIIHAHGRVRLDKLTPSGIESVENGQITHSLFDIRSLTVHS